MSKKDVKPVDWELLLFAAARLHQIFPVTVLVGGTEAALHAGHRVSYDADHVIHNLRDRFDEVLLELEAESGWTLARFKRPVLILGNLDGVETGVRQLIRSKPLETTTVNYKGLSLTIPTEEEILRIKSVLTLKRNATRDYVDFIAVADHLGVERAAMALSSFDGLYPQESGQSALQQLLAQLSYATPYDLKNVSLANYKGLSERWRDFEVVRTACADMAVEIFDLIVENNLKG
jgi:hypothetical protein